MVLYNRFVTLVQRTKEAWADIDVQLKRRYDLIPNLVDTVKGYAAHEKSTFESVTDARTKAMGAGGVAEKGQAENMLSGALKSLFAVAEAYPELKANTNFLELAARALRHRKQNPGGAPLLQRQRARPQHRSSGFPGNIIAGISTLSNGVL